MTEPSTPPADAGSLDLRALADLLEASLLGGPRKYTRVQVCELTGVSMSESEQLWRSMGFASAGDDEVLFTDADVDALRRVSAIRSVGSIESAVMIAMSRAMGQTFAQMASWEGQIALETVVEQMATIGSEDGTAGIVDFAERLLPLLEQTHTYVWRRQLAAYIARKLAQVEAPPAGAVATVGFADITGYTALSRRSTEAELQRLLEDFESTVAYTVGPHGGRVVKLIGDAALFLADTPVAGAEIALDLQDRWSDGERPPIRAGLAAGPVVSRLGDVFGTTVNIASRLTSMCRPGSVLVDRTMADALAAEPGYRLRSRRPESVRGYHHLHSWQLQRAGETTARRGR